jgi:ParB family chromosome partitioning protein
MNLVEVGKTIRVSDIKISPYHFRKETVAENLERLGKSIQQVGLIHAVSVVKDTNGFELINGHRRLRAHEQLGIPGIRANVYEFTPEERADEAAKQAAIAQFLFAANQSEPLVPVERARFYRDAIDKLGLSLEDLAEVHNCAVSEIEDDLMYLSIATPVLDLVAAAPQRFGNEHLRILAEYASPSKKKAWRITPEEQEKLAKKLLNQEDKKMVASPKVFEAAIRETVRERRAKAEEVKKRLRGPRSEVEAIKDLVSRVEDVEKAERELEKVDLALVTEIDLADKREIMSRLYSVSETLVAYAEQKINSLKVKRHAAQAVRA